MTIAALIVGLGQIGMGYDLRLSPTDHIMSHARAFAMHPAFELAGGVDPQSENREAFEDVYRRRAFAQLGEALEFVKPELVVIAVPTPLHERTLMEILARCRPRAILCEKPLASELPAARNMVRACAERDVRLYVNYMRRSDPGVMEVKRRLDSGEIQGPIKGVAWYSKGLLHSGSHFFNLLTYWLGDMIDARIIEPGRLWNNEDPEPDISIQFEKGRVIFLAAREEDFSHYTIELIASNGRLRYEKAGHLISWQPAHFDKVFKKSKTINHDIEIIASEMNVFQYNVAMQIDLDLSGKKAHLSDGDDAYRTLESLTTIAGKR